MARNDMTAALANPAEEHESVDARGFARRRFERMVVPFAMPLLIGPGAISAVIIYAAEARQYGLFGSAVSLLVIAALSLCILAAFMLTPLISRVLGRIGMTITVRVSGLILCAMAVQFVIIGLHDATTGFVRPSVAAPYASARGR